MPRHQLHRKTLPPGHYLPDPGPSSRVSTVSVRVSKPDGRVLSKDVSAASIDLGSRSPSVSFRPTPTIKDVSAASFDHGSRSPSVSFRPTARHRSGSSSRTDAEVCI